MLEDGEADSDSDVSMDSEDEAKQAGASAPRVVVGRRVWSPSRPLADSSDEGSADEREPIPDVVPGRSAQPNSLPITSPSYPLSTFHPVPSNTFPLSAPETVSLGLPALPAVALVLPPQCTLTLLGTYRLLLLRGAVSLLGVTLHPSRTAHAVFAPRCAPVPVLEAVDAGEPGSEQALDFSARVRDALGPKDTVIVLQEMATGVEGLGRIVRTFESAFRLEGGAEDAVLPLAGVNMVDEIF